MTFIGQLSAHQLTATHYQLQAISFKPIVIIENKGYNTKRKPQQLSDMELYMFIEKKRK